MTTFYKPFSIERLNNEFNKKIKLSDTVSQIKNNTTSDEYITEQQINIDGILNFNNNFILNTNPIPEITQSDLKKTANSYKNRNVYEYKNIIVNDSIVLKCEKTFNLTEFIKMSTLTETAIHLSDIEGNIVTTIKNCIKNVFNINTVTFLVNNTDGNTKISSNKDKYVTIKNNNIPINIVNNTIEINNNIILNHLLLLINNTNQNNFIQFDHKVASINYYKFGFKIRFDINNKNCTFPIFLPQINTNLDSKLSYTNPIEYVCYIKVPDSINILDQLKNNIIKNVFIYI